MRTIVMPLLGFFSLLLIMGCSKGRDDYEAIVRGRVINTKNNSLIANARIRALDETTFSNLDGDFEFTLDLGKYILDYIDFEVEAENFNKEFVKTRIVADINSGMELDFYLTPKDLLTFSPPQIECFENEDKKLLSVLNTGINDINILIRPLDSWITVSPTSGTVKPNVDFPLDIAINSSSFDCFIDGKIEIRQSDKNIKDTIAVSKFIEDDEIPLAQFTHAPDIALQFDEIFFDATSSSDNCAYLFPLLYRWQWDVNTGLSNWSPEASLFHSYDCFGQKKVTLEVKDRRGNIAAVSKEITVSIAPTVPTVELGLISETDYLSLIVGATIIDIGQLSSGVLSSGVVWSNTDPMPDIENNLGKTEEFDQSGVGGFSSEVTGLRIDQTYHIRAYARNEYGFGYSEVQEMKPNLLDMVHGESGTFGMGDDSDLNDDNSPIHDVIISKGFSISKYEITNQQYVVFLNDVADLPSSLVWLNINDINCRIGYQNNEFVVETGYENYPVVSVSWEGANEFCKWIGGRLPTEAEWEYCARGGSGVNPADYTLYSGSNTPGQVAYYMENSGNEIHPVGEKKPNELGLYDMSGNVSEWCSDWYGPNYYNGSPTQNPTGPNSGTKKIARGGNYSVSKEFLTVFYREKRTPNIKNNHFGFRSVR